MGKKYSIEKCKQIKGQSCTFIRPRQKDEFIKIKEERENHISVLMC